LARRPLHPTWTWGGWIAAAIAAATCAFFARYGLMDDAFISFRYARNLLDGQGLVFNPGERVEGYSNLTWVLLIAAAMRVGFDPVVMAKVFGALFATLTVFLLARPLSSGDDRLLRRAGPLAAAFLALNASVAMWAVHGLETALYAVLILLGVREDASAHARGTVPRASGLVYAVASLTRPEAPVVAVMSGAFGIATNRSAWFSRNGLRWLGSFAAVVAAHLAWRYGYYGDVVSNVAHAKVPLGLGILVRGAGYVAQALEPPLLLPWALAAAAIILRGRRREVLFLAAVLIAMVAAVIAEGGDGFQGFRFLVPVFPVLYLLAAIGFLGAYDRCPKGAARAGLIAVCLVGAATHGWALFGPAHREAMLGGGFTDDLREVGLALRRLLPPHATIALNPAGAVPYYSGLRAIDMLGLNDRHIARVPVSKPGTGQAGHEKGDGAYVLTRRPDALLMGNVHIVDSYAQARAVTRVAAVNRSEHELIGQPDLLRLYERAFLQLADGRWLVYLRRRSGT
jgi:arabinofuranosyltransferase